MDSKGGDERKKREREKAKNNLVKRLKGGKRVGEAK
jgi:hypothetical protein